MRAQGLGPRDPGAHLTCSASLGICILIRKSLHCHSLDFLRSHSLDLLRSRSLVLVNFRDLGHEGPGPGALGPRGSLWIVCLEFCKILRAQGLSALMLQTPDFLSRSAPKIFKAGGSTMNFKTVKRDPS